MARRPTRSCCVSEMGEGMPCSSCRSPFASAQPSPRGCTRCRHPNSHCGSTDPARLPDDDQGPPCTLLRVAAVAMSRATLKIRSTLAGSVHRWLAKNLIQCSGEIMGWSE